MGLAGAPTPDSETTNLLSTTSTPNDTFHLTYISYFTLGVGYLLPWNAFITAVDYFNDIYPNTPVDRIFAMVYFSVGLLSLFFIIFYAQRRSAAFLRINVGLGLFVVALLVVSVMDAVYIRARVGLFSGFYVTVGMVGLAGIADALVQGGIIGAAGELPERYMQAIVAGTGASGVLVAALRLLTKAVFAQDVSGLRKSANLYFAIGIIAMVVCIIFYNFAHKLPVIRYYADLKIRAINEEKEEINLHAGAHWRSTLWEVVGSTKWYGIGLFLICVVTISIYPGYITEDVHSATLKDWYATVLIFGFNVFDLIGKSLTAVYLIGNGKVAVGGCFARLLFYPFFILCMHGPEFFRTEIPVSILTCLLGFTNGYFTSVLLIMAPKVVPIQHSETVGTVMVLFLVIGLSVGSVVAWFWVI